MRERERGQGAKGRRAPAERWHRGERAGAGWVGMAGSGGGGPSWHAGERRGVGGVQSLKMCLILAHEYSRSDIYLLGTKDFRLW